MNQFKTNAITLTLQRQKFLSLMLLTLLSFVSLTAQADNDLALQPSPRLTPQDVVNFQLKALQEASVDGISATFRFASPANRKMTGPVERFSGLFKSPSYQPMLNNRSSKIELIRNDSFTAELLAEVVDSSGELHWYHFRLSRQSEAPYENCWMTDAVMSVPYPGDSA